MGLLAELRRRNVIRMAGLYLVGASLWDKYGAPDACRRIAPGDYRCE